MDQEILPPTHSLGYVVSLQKWVKELVVVPGLLLSAPGHSVPQHAHSTLVTMLAVVEEQWFL